MKKSISDKINALQGSAASQEEFMKKLAEIDENGQLTQEVQVAVNGGAVPGSLKSPIIDLPVLGLWFPPTTEFPS